MAFAQETAQTIIQRSVEANNRDWKEAPEFDFCERDQEKGTDKTYSVTMVDGSPYERLIAVNGKPLEPSQQAEEQEKLRRASAERQHESPSKRSARIAKYEAERRRNQTMTSQLTAAFDFTLVGEQELKGRKVYVLKATPRPGYHAVNRDSEVLTGMEGQLWIDHDTYQWVRVEAHVIHPVRISGFLAEVEPGTRFELEKTPVSDDVWLTSHFSMKADAKVLMLVSHHSQEEDTFFDYHRANNSASAAQSSSVR
jgi:hypothetical protein